ncbi:MAG: GNAT family N-acetyltransferase [Bacteroidetes bacterium]|nr:GNAT family N-acetyltransferase [Bacteroidota bacterium]
MNFKLIPASQEHIEIIKNLMQFYIYDFSEYVDCDVEENGLYKDYPHLDDYWKEKHHRFPYLIIQEEKYIGFVLVRIVESHQRNFFSIAEFFIMRKYRREGIGKTVAIQIFNLHKGYWEIFQRESNKPAQLFWNKIIDEYTNGEFVERAEEGKLIQNFEN